MKRLNAVSYVNMAVTVGGVLVTVLWFQFGTAATGVQNGREIADMKQNLATMQNSINTLQSSVAVSQANIVQIQKNTDDMRGDIKGIYKLVLENKTSMRSDAHYTTASY